MQPLPVHREPTSSGPPLAGGPESGATSGRAGLVEPANWFRRAFSSLRHRNYRLYFFGQMVSQSGTWVQTTALMWLAFELTQSNRWPAWIVGLHIFPTCLLGPWGGVLADRFPKRWLLFWTQLGYMALSIVLAMLEFSGAVRPWHLLLVAGISGLVNAVDFPARLSFVMEMVGRDDLMNAVGLNASLFNGARAIGPAIGGVLLTWLGPGACFVLNALTYSGVLLALARMDPISVAEPVGSSRGLRYVLEGFRYVQHNVRLAGLLALVGAIGFFGWPFLALLPAFASDILHVQAQGYSVLLSTTGFGALAAALGVAAAGTVARRRLFITTGVLTVATMLLGLSISTDLVLAAICSGFVGFGLVLFFATSQSVVQLAAEDHNRGRVMGVWSMVVSGSQPLGNFLAGPLADRWTEPRVMQAQGLACLVAAAGMLSLLWFMDRDSRKPVYSL